jgi:hypothetical protein
MHLTQKAQRVLGIGLLCIAMTAVSLGFALVAHQSEAVSSMKVLCLSLLPALSLVTTTAIASQQRKLSRT